MNENSKTDWTAFDAITEEEVEKNALTDPDASPRYGKSIKLSDSDGPTLIERFRKALEREKKVSLTVRYDADIVRYYKAKGKGYQAVMNAALRACMEAEKAER